MPFSFIPSLTGKYPQFSFCRTRVPSCCTRIPSCRTHIPRAIFHHRLYPRRDMTIYRDMSVTDDITLTRAGHSYILANECSSSKSTSPDSKHPGRLSADRLNRDGSVSSIPDKRVSSSRPASCSSLVLQGLMQPKKHLRKTSFSSVKEDGSC